jgi:vacuolar iron transporter family protein
MLYTPAMASPSTVDHHHERHFQSGDTVRDIVIGMSDGLTVPFALAAGLSRAVDSLHIIVLAGLAEIAAGAVAMGLGGYLAARGDAEHYRNERLREQHEVVERRRDEEEEVYQIFDAYGVERHEATPVLTALQRNPAAWVDFMMRFELGLEEPQAGRALRSAMTIAASYVLGGLVPLLPYMLGTPQTALPASVGITLLALLLFGAVKGRVTGAGTVRSGLQTVVIGGLAAAAAFGLAHLLSAP